MSYRFSAPYTYLSEDINFCFHINRLSNCYQVKPVKHCYKDGGQFRAIFDKVKEILCEIQQFVV